MPFKLALEKLQVPEEKVWMIGDSAKSDIYGSNINFNMTSIQKLHQGVELGKGESAPDLSFNDYYELEKLIKKLKS